MEMTYNNLRFENTTQSLYGTRSKDISHENYKTSKSYHLLSSFQTIRQKFYNTRNKDLLVNQRYYDTEMLKQQLNSFKATIHEKKSIYLSLKIKYGKLYNENLNNKNIISNVLGVPLDKYVTREEVMDKIENAKLDKIKRKILKEAYDGILLKMEIEDKKEEYNKNSRYLKELKDNSKTKKINDYINDFVDKCEQQRKLLRTLKFLGEKTNLFDEEKTMLGESLEKEKLKKNENQKTKEEKIKTYQELMEERTNISRQNKILAERIKKYLMLSREKAERIRQKCSEIKELESDFEEIERYKKERKSSIQLLEEKTKLEEESRKYRKEQEQIIKKLISENDELNDKMNNYNDEKPRLIKKAKEPKPDIDKMKQLEAELKKIKNETEKQKKLHEEKQIELKKIDEAEKQKNEEYKGIIDNNNNSKNDMNKKIEELNNKIIELTEKIEKKRKSENKRRKN